MKEKYKYVFVVLVYKNTDVLTTFFESMQKIDDKKVILVNSYYDDDSLARCKDAAMANGADFIPVPNRGFGAGNNRGIEYAKEHYEFDYLVLSNSDIIIRTWAKAEELPSGASVIAPQTRMLTGKNQNPNIPYYPAVGLWLHKQYVRTENKRFLDIAHILSRGGREVFLLYSRLFKKNRYKIFSVHGSFMLFSSEALDRLMPVFDERIFLYNEEGYLACKCRHLNIPCYYCPAIQVTHLEGASSHGTMISEEYMKSLKILMQVRGEKDYFHGVEERESITKN